MTSMVRPPSRLFLFAMLLLALLTVSVGLHHIAQDAVEGDGTYGDVRLDPETRPPRAGQTFALGLRYVAGTNSVPPGSRLEIIPFANRVDEGPPAPMLGVYSKDRVLKAVVTVDPFYSSLSVDKAGATYRYFVEFPQGMRSGESVHFSATLRNIRAPAYGRHCLAEAALEVSLLAPTGDVLQRFPMPNWTMPPMSAAHMKTRLLIPSQGEVRKRTEVLVSVAGRDGPAYHAVPGLRIVGPDSVQVSLPEFDLQESDRGSKRVVATFGGSGVFRLRLLTGAGGEIMSNPIRIGGAATLNGKVQIARDIFWGELHNHTIYSWDTRNMLQACRDVGDAVALARAISMLDFIAVTDHGPHDMNGIDTGDSGLTQVDMSESDWRRYQQEVVAAETPDIVTFVGYEHRDARGDTNMVYRRGGRNFVEDGRRLNHQAVWKRSPPGELLSIPHLHPQRGLDNFNTLSGHERLVEIHSAHTTYEYYRNPSVVERIEEKHGPQKRGPFVLDLLDKGFRFGFVACADHATPGFVGQTAVLAEGKGRDALFDALLARHTYATTGPRMLLDFNVAGVAYGDEVVVSKGHAAAQERSIDIEVHAQGAIAKVEIIRNGEVYFEQVFSPLQKPTLDWSTTIVDTDSLARISPSRIIDGIRSSYYYLRVTQQDAHRGWSSPVFFVLPR